MQLVLASTSPFRRELLSKLEILFETASPECDETRLEGEPPEQMVARLAEMKARAVAAQFPNALIIGSDQAATFDGLVLGKPHTYERAFTQLSQASGKKVIFHTGLCLLNSATGNVQCENIPFSVYFRKLNSTQIESYLSKEQPYNCAGSFKSEGLGITLFEKFEGDDPNALIGLPLIKLTSMLANEGRVLP